MNRADAAGWSMEMHGLCPMAIQPARVRRHRRAPTLPGLIMAGGAVSMLCVSALAAGEPAAPAAMPVNQADVRGGFESSYVITRIKAGSQPVKLADGRWTITKTGQVQEALDPDAKAI